MTAIRRQFKSMLDFLWPAYQPERHYMRGPGPACRKRQVNIADVG